MIGLAPSSPPSLHDALPISPAAGSAAAGSAAAGSGTCAARPNVQRWWSWSWCSSSVRRAPAQRSEEHTSELQSRGHLVCRLLLEKKNESIGVTLFLSHRAC